MVIGQELEMALGLPVEITSFVDGVPRKCYPFNLKTLYRANTYLNFFDQKDMVGNLQQEESSIGMMCFLSESFKDADTRELLTNITKENFPEIIEDIKFVNGFVDSCGEKDLDAAKESIDWLTSINAIQTYTSNTVEEISKMSLYQFSTLLNFIGKKINWEYKTGMLDVVAEPNDFIEVEDHPLSNSSKIEHKNHMTMEDIMGLSTLQKGSE